MFGHIVWYSFIEHALILRSEHNKGAILFAVLHLSSHSYYLLPFRSSSENMFLLHKKDILISEHDQGSAVGFVSTPSLCFMPIWFVPFFLQCPLPIFITS